MLFGNKLSGNGQAQGPVPTQLSFSNIYKIEMGHYFFESGCLVVGLSFVCVGYKKQQEG